MSPMQDLYKMVFLSFFLLLSIYASAQVADTTTGLISHWTFDESSGTVAVNSANENFNASLENTSPGALTWLPTGGAIGGAAQFNGSGGCFRTPYFDLPAENVTISLWVKSDFTKNNGWRGIFYDRTDGNKGFMTENGQLMPGKWTSGGGGGEYYSGLYIPDNTWTFISLTVSPTLMKVNMRPQGAANFSTWSQGGTFSGTQLKQFAIGDDFWGSNLIGAIDDVRMYSRVLTTNDLDALYSLGSSALVANAGKDRVVYLPYNNITLSGTDSDNGVTSRKWELIKGTATLGATSGNKLNVSGLTEGNYVFRYTVTDSQGTTSDEIKVTAKYIDVLASRPTDPGRIKTKQFTNGKTLVTPEGERLRGYWEGGYKDPLDEYYNNPEFFRNLRNMGFNAVKVWWENTNFGGSYTDVNDSLEVANSLMYMDSIINLASRYGLQIMIEGGNISYYQDASAEVMNFRKENMQQWWSILARRYKDRTHVFYEMQNEPLYIDLGNYPVVEDTKKWYQLMRSQAPETQIVLFAFMVMQSKMVNIVDDLNSKATIDWEKTTVGYHGYGDVKGNINEITALRAKYPVIETEFWPEKGLGETPWPTTDRANFYEMEALEKEEISWFSWTSHKTQKYDAFLPPILADLKARGEMWNFTPVDFKEPVIIANDTTIYEPENSITINAKVSSPERILVRYEWQLRKTTGLATMTSNGPSVTLTGMQKGIYWLRLLVWDDAGYYSAKDIQVVLTQRHQIPGIIEAEDFSAMINIGTEECFDEGGGLNVGWIALDSHMDYAVKIEQTGMYLIELREAGEGDGGLWKLSIDGEQVTPVIEVPGTGGWQIFTSIYSNAVLPAGNHTLRFNALRTGSNINWYKFRKTDATIQASPDQIITLPASEVELSVTATDPSGIKSYAWKLLQGKATSVLTNAATDKVTVSKLEVGEYLFNVTVRTNNDIPYNASVKVTVVPCSDVVTVNAGPDLKITLPTNSAEITAVANAASGIATYSWKQTAGVAATLVDANTSVLKVSGLQGDKVYRFVVTVTSNGSCIGTDEVKVTVYISTATDPDMSNDLAIIIYPNPAKHMVTIERSDGNKNIIVQLSDVKGKILKQSIWENDRFEWRVDQYSKGLYIISFSDGDKIFRRKLLIE